MTEDVKLGRSHLGALVFGGLLFLGYSVFAHITSATPGVGAWAILIAAAPIVVVAVAFARDSAWGMLLLLLTVLGIGLLAWLWDGLDNPVAWLYFLQQFSINMVLAWVFGRTLLGGRCPLCTMFASTVHPSMTPELLRYTRGVTLAWSIFFAAVALVSAALFFLASIEAWSYFANILSWPLVGLMFVAENRVRKYVLPPQDQFGLRATIQAFRTNFRS